LLIVSRNWNVVKVQGVVLKAEITEEGDAEFLDDKVNGACSAPIHDPSEDVSTIRMGVEYLPEYLPSDRCVENIDPSWSLSDCPDFVMSIQHTLGDWTNSKNPIHTPPVEFGFFSMIHSTFERIIIAADAGKQLYFTPLEKWSNDGTSFETWLENKAYFPSYSSDYKPADTTKSLVNKCKEFDLEGVNNLVKFVAVSQIMTALLRPVPFIEDMVTERKERLHWGNNDKVIGLYIRRGDACLPKEVQRTKRSCDDLITYMEEVRRVSEKYKTNKVYLLSDSGDYMYNQTRDYPEYHWMFESSERKSEESLKMEKRLGKTIDGRKEGTEMLTDFLTLSSTNVLIGKVTSNVFRAAIEYASGKMGARIPYISMDAPWCFCFHCSAIIEKGPFKGQSFAC